MTVGGGCLCGKVRYRIAAPLGPLIYCHCSQCRKAQGVGFAANTPVALSSFEILSGGELLTAFRASNNKSRYFCSNCSSAIYSHLDEADTVRIRAGTLDSDTNVVPNGHSFTGSRASWVTIQDTLDQHEEREPGRV